MTNGCVGPPNSANSKPKDCGNRHAGESARRSWAADGVRPCGLQNDRHRDSTPSGPRVFSTRSRTHTPLAAGRDWGFGIEDFRFGKKSPIQNPQSSILSRRPRRTAKRHWPRKTEGTKGIRGETCLCGSLRASVESGPWVRQIPCCLQKAAKDRKGTEGRASRPTVPTFLSSLRSPGRPTTVGWRFSD